MIGVSLPLGWLTETEAPTGILQLLKDQGAGSVELRTVRPHHEPEDVLLAAKRLWDMGFQITVHGSVTAVETAVEEIFNPLTAVLADLRQDKLNVTIHPIVGDNAALLIALSDHILTRDLPVTISLENNRRMPDKTQGDSAKLVLEAVKKADRPNVGICFDMGHYAYYVKKNCPETPELLPDKEFWGYVTHTHIHALKDLKTHFPLGAFELPLEAILEKLSFGYFGVYNLELDFPRILPDWEPEAALAQSLPYLKSKLHICAGLYDQVREGFDGWFAKALEGWNTENSFSLIHATSYLFHTGCKWAMDIAFRNARYLANSPARAAELLKDARVMLLTHGHRDHYEESTLLAMAKNDTLFVVPDFLEERTLKLGIPREKLVISRPGERLQLFGLTVLPLESSHYRPDGKGVREYGYHVTTESGITMAFPGDIRDFSKTPKELPPADYCFGHVWLTDEALTEESWRSAVAPWAQYMLGFSQKHIFLTHLWEDGRPDNRMWRTEHALAVQAELGKRSPNTRVTIPARGETVSLV